MDVRVKRKAKRRIHSGAPRIKWWHFKSEKQRIFQQRILEGGFRQPHGSANDMWERMTHEIKKVAKETLGESRRFGPRSKESWWWNDSVQSKGIVTPQFPVLKISLNKSYIRVIITKECHISSLKIA